MASKMRVFLVFLLLLLSNVSSLIQNGSMSPIDSLHRFFTYFDYRMSWSQAQHMCQQHGLHLVTIQNLNEASAIATLVKNYQQNENIWIKLEKPNQNSQWKIIDQPGNRQRNNLKDQEVIIKQKVCVELVAMEGFLKWNNTDCQERRPFLCQTLHFHSEFWMQESKITKLSKKIESNEENEDYKLTKYDGEMRKKYRTKENKTKKETLFTNNHSSEKSLTPLLMVSLVFASFFISLFPKIKSPKQNLQTYMVCPESIQPCNMKKYINNSWILSRQTSELA